MTRNVADDLWDMLIQAGVKRCYGIVGDALNPTTDSLSRHSEIEFIHVRHEEWGAFAASADAQLTKAPVAVCGTAGPGVTHLLNGLLDALHEQAPVIAIAGDVETSIIDTHALEEVSPYDLFRTASLYTGRVVNAVQARAVFQQAITVATEEQGPTVIALPGDVASAKSPLASAPKYTPSRGFTMAPVDADVQAAAELINGSDRIFIFGGNGTAQAADLVIELAGKINGPVGYTLKGKNWLEADNPHAVGMTGLLGYGAAHDCIKHAEVMLMLGADFPFPGFLDRGESTIIQVDSTPSHLGRRVAVEMGVASDVRTFLERLLPLIEAKEFDDFLTAAQKTTESWNKRLRRYVDGGESRSPIRPEYLASLLDELMDSDAVVSADTGTSVIWLAHQMSFGGDRFHFGSYSWASMADASPYAFGASKACPGRQVIAFCGDGGFSMLGLGDLLTERAHRSRIVHVILNNEELDFVNIEQQEAGIAPWGTEFPPANFAAIAEGFGVKGIRCEDPALLREQLQEALSYQDGPVVSTLR